MWKVLLVIQKSFTSVEHFLQKLLMLSTLKFIRTWKTEYEEKIKNSISDFHCFTLAFFSCMIREEKPLIHTFNLIKNESRSCIFFSLYKKLVTIFQMMLARSYLLEGTWKKCG